MPRIPVGNKYTSTLSGSALKHVTCSYCGCQFVYQMKREASGEASSFLWLNNNGASYKATKIANENLSSKLQEEIDARSCPDCGMYQENMVQKLKRNAWNDVFSVAFSFGIIGVILAVIVFFVTISASKELQSILLIAIAGFWIWSVSKKAIYASNLDPNANADKRKGRHYSEKYPVLRLSELEKELESLRQKGRL